MDGYSTRKIRRSIVMASFALSDVTLPGTDNIPYISNTLGEALLLCLKRAPEKLIIVAILKDAYERQLISDSKILKAFGSIVLKIIQQKLERHEPLFLAVQECKLEENVHGYDLARLKKATYLASYAHRYQKRKEAGIPVISHPLGAAMHLGLLRVPQAGIEGEILHDVLEDTDLPAEEIARTFGQEVLDIVLYCTETDKHLPWEERKQQTIAKARQADLLTKQVICADKLNNMQSIYDQLLREKLKNVTEFRQAKVWDHFSKGHDWQKWYYQEITRAIMANVALNDLQPIFGTMMRLVERVFGETVIKDRLIRSLVASR